MMDNAEVWPWGATPRPRSGWWPRGTTPGPRSGAAAGKNYPKPEARGGGQEEQPYIQGEVAVRQQEGGEELLHIEGQEGWP